MLRKLEEGWESLKKINSNLYVTTLIFNYGEDIEGHYGTLSECCDYIEKYRELNGEDCGISFEKVGIMLNM